MPQVFKLGSYWVYFWTNENNPVEPIHVHISEGKPVPHATKVWITKDGNEKIVIPDASINCRVKARKGKVFLDIPRFVMEVLSPSTENYDRTEKMNLYKEQEIDEYWIVNWKKRQVEIYTLDYNEEEQPEYYFFKVITEKNKEELKIVHFPNVEITFEELFEIRLS